MMRITDRGPWPSVAIAPAGSNATGDWVVGLGQPNGFFSDRAPPVRLGRILHADDATLCTDVTLVGGDSGGPLFNLRGQVVGIHSRIGRRITSNYHVPIGQFHLGWTRLLAGQIWGGELDSDEPVEHRPLLGVAGDPREGPCRLTQVFPGMPADQAGLREGDIVLRFGEQQVESFAQLARLVMAAEPGARVEVEVERDGGRVKATVRLGQIGDDFPGSPPTPQS